MYGDEDELLVAIDNVSVAVAGIKRLPTTLLSVAEDDWREYVQWGYCFDGGATIKSVCDRLLNDLDGPVDGWCSVWQLVLAVEVDDDFVSLLPKSNSSLLVTCAESVEWAEKKICYELQ